MGNNLPTLLCELFTLEWIKYQPLIFVMKIVFSVFYIRPKIKCNMFPIPIRDPGGLGWYNVGRKQLCSWFALTIRSVLCSKSEKKYYNTVKTAKNIFYAKPLDNTVNLSHKQDLFVYSFHTFAVKAAKCGIWANKFKLIICGFCLPLKCMFTFSRYPYARKQENNCSILAEHWNRVLDKNNKHLTHSARTPEWLRRVDILHI